MSMWLTSYHHHHYSGVFICSYLSLFVIQGDMYSRFTSNASIIVPSYLPQVGHRWGLVGICKYYLLKSPPLGITSCCKSPTILYRDFKNMDNFWRKIMLTNHHKSPQIPTHCLTWGRQGMKMIGA